jgi:hypothetical protein
VGYPPPPDFPPPEQQAGIEAEASFAPTPGGPSLCGFVLPTFGWRLSYRLPAFPPFPFPPTFNFFLGLNCDLSNPIEAEFGFGGGRASTGTSPDYDEEFGGG